MGRASSAVTSDGVGFPVRPIDEILDGVFFVEVDDLGTLAELWLGMTIDFVLLVLSHCCYPVSVCCVTVLSNVVCLVCRTSSNPAIATTPMPTHIASDTEALSNSAGRAEGSTGAVRAVAVLKAHHSKAVPAIPIVAQLRMLEVPNHNATIAATVPTIGMAAPVGIPRSNSGVALNWTIVTNMAIASNAIAMIATDIGLSRR